MDNLNFQIDEHKQLGFQLLEQGLFQQVEFVISAIETLEKEQLKVKEEASGQIFNWLNSEEYFDHFIDLHGQQKSNAL